MLVSDIRPPPLKYAAQVLTDHPDNGQLFSLTGQVRLWEMKRRIDDEVW